MKFRTYTLLCIFLNVMCASAHDAYITIEQASLADLNDIIALNTTITYEYFKPILLQYPEYEENESELEQKLANVLEHEAGWFADCITAKNDKRLFVAHCNGVIAGFAACHKQDEIIVLDLLLISAEHRNKGVGRNLVRSCICAFPELTMCLLIVLDKNEPARAFYEKIGFVLTDEKPIFVQQIYPESRYICYQLSLNSGNTL